MVYASPVIIKQVQGENLGQYDHLSLVQPVRRTLQLPEPGVAVTLDVVPVTAESASALYLGGTPQILSGRAGFRGWTGPEMHVVQHNWEKPIAHYDGRSHNPLIDSLRFAGRRAVPITSAAAGLMLYFCNTVQGEDNGQKWYTPDRLFFSTTCSTGSGPFLKDAQRATEEQGRQVEQGYVLEPGSVDIKTFRDQARKFMIWTPGFGPIWDVSNNVSVFAEASWAKGNVKSKGTETSHVIPGMPGIETGLVDWKAKLTRESATIGTGFMAFPWGRDGMLSPYLKLAAGAQFAGYEAKGTTAYEGSPGWGIPGQITKLKEEATDWGWYASPGAGFSFRITPRLIWDLSASYQIVGELENVSKDFGQVTIASALMWELGGKPEHPKPSLISWIRGK